MQKLGALDKFASLDRRISSLSALEAEQQQVLADMGACEGRLESVLVRIKLLLGGTSRPRDHRDQPKKLSDRVELAIKEKRNRK